MAETGFSCVGTRSADNYERLCLIGSGTYGDVFKARDKATGEIVAMKKILLSLDEKEGFPITAIREIKILQKMNHQNVIKLKEIVTVTPAFEVDDPFRNNDNTVLMVFEYMDHDLTGLSQRVAKFSVPQIKVRGYTDSRDTTQCYMKQLLTGLHYCHRNKIIHRDIKASNLLINNDGILKLADFGLARVYLDDMMTNRVVTLWYRPPELLLGSCVYGPAIDIWSTGCILAELLLQRPLFPGKAEPEQIELIFGICGTPNEDVWPGVTSLPHFGLMTQNRRPSPPRLREILMKSMVDPLAVDLLERMLALDPRKRLSALEALDAQYFWSNPLPCEPQSLPKYESAHEYSMKKRGREHQQREESRRCQNHRPNGSRGSQGGYSHPNGNGQQLENASGVLQGGYPHPNGRGQHLEVRSRGPQGGLRGSQAAYCHPDGQERSRGSQGGFRGSQAAYSHPDGQERSRAAYSHLNGRGSRELSESRRRYY